MFFCTRLKPIFSSFCTYEKLSLCFLRHVTGFVQMGHIWYCDCRDATTSYTDEEYFTSCKTGISTPRAGCTWHRDSSGDWWNLRSVWTCSVVRWNHRASGLVIKECCNHRCVWKREVVNTMTFITSMDNNTCSGTSDTPNQYTLIRVLIVHTYSKPRTLMFIINYYNI